MPLFAEPLINYNLIERATAYLQTLDPAYFPFAAGFDEERQKAFVRDLRIGLSDLTESGSKRGTASVGYITSDKRLRAVIDDWAHAEGGWPLGQDPKNKYGVAGAAQFNDDEM